MKFKITDSAASSLAVLAIAARIFCGVIIDMPSLYNAGWLSILLGGLLALPLALAAGKLRVSCPTSPAAAMSERFPPAFRALAAAFAILALYDAAIIARATASSASYVALNSLPMIYLLLPQLLLCLWCLSMNGDAIGFAAGIWKRILPLLLLIVVLLQFSAYKPSWLMPILGPGAADLLDGAVRVAGWISMLSGLFLIAERDPQGSAPRFQPLKILVLSALIAAGLILLRSMMTPPLFMGSETSIFFQLDTLLSNGRAPLSLQLPLIALWFVSLMLLLLFDAFLCAAMLQRALPFLGKWPCIAIVLAGIGGLALCDLTSRAASRLASGWLYAIQGAIFALYMALLLIPKKEAAHA